jgi:hypothetical protein
LQAATLVLSVLLAVAFAGNLFSDYAPLIGIRASILAAFVGSYFVLRGSRPFSSAQLRGFEAGLFVAPIVQLLLMMGTRLVAFAKADDAVSLVAAQHAYLSGWSVLILTHGILMPNTWRRALALLLAAAYLPYGLVLWLRWQIPGIDAALQADRLGVLVPMPIVAALVAVFGTHVINSIRREAFKARQLGQYVLKTKLGGSVPIL